MDRGPYIILRAPTQSRLSKPNIGELELAVCNAGHGVIDAYYSININQQLLWLEILTNNLAEHMRAMNNKSGA